MKKSEEESDRIYYGCMVVLVIYFIVIPLLMWQMWNG